MHVGKNAHTKERLTSLKLVNQNRITCAALHSNQLLLDPIKGSPIQQLLLLAILAEVVH